MGARKRAVEVPSSESVIDFDFINVFNLSDSKSAGARAKSAGASPPSRPRADHS